MYFDHIFLSQELNFNKCSTVHTTYKVTKDSSTVKSSTATLDDLLASFSHRGDQLVFGWVLGYSFQNLGLPGWKRLLPRFHPPELFLCPCPGMLLCPFPKCSCGLRSGE